MIVLIGVGHVFNIWERVRAEIISANPDIVCVELDVQRAEGFSKRNTGYEHPLYALLSNFQKMIAKKFNTEPGMEMRVAIEVAKELNVEVEFIDIDALTIIERIWREMSFVERVRLLASLFFGLFLSKRNVEESVAEFMESQSEVVKELEKEFPTIKRILIDERDDYMAWRISMSAKNHSNVVCVLGEGHIEGISKRLASKGLAHRIVPLRALLSNKNSEYTCSYVW